MSLQNIYQKRIRNLNGFTLLELIVTVFIVGIIFAAGIPGLQSLLGNVALNSSADKLVNSLAYARGEAVTRAENVSGTLLGAPQIGWRVFLDANSNCDFDTGEEVLREVDITADNVTVAFSGGVSCVGFNELGETRDDTAVSLTIDSLAASSNTSVINISPIGYTSIN